MAVDFLLTGFRSFTQDERGNPLPNPTETLLRMICDAPFAGSAPVGLWTGRARLAGRDCVLAVADVNYHAPLQFVDLFRTLRPQAVICLGLGGETVIETGALNRVDKARPTYDSRGLPLSGVFPSSSYLDRQLPEDAEIQLPWGDANLARLREVASRWHGNGPLGPVSVAPSARLGNNYVCNATAWTVARCVTRETACAGFIHFAPPAAPPDGYFLAAANLLVDLVRSIRPE